MDGMINYFKGVLNSFKEEQNKSMTMKEFNLYAVLHKLLEMAIETMEESSSQPIASAEYKEPNPFIIPSYEERIRLIDFRVKYGNIISNHFLASWLTKDAKFMEACGSKTGPSEKIYLISPTRALNYMWDHAGPKVKNKLRRYAQENGLIATK